MNAGPHGNMKGVTKDPARIRHHAGVQLRHGAVRARHSTQAPPPLVESDTDRLGQTNRLDVPLPFPFKPLLKRYTALLLIHARVPAPEPLRRGKTRGVPFSRPFLFGTGVTPACQYPVMIAN